MNQGNYPIGNRVLAGTDTVTGVVTGTTADVPLAQLVAFILTAAGGGSGPTASRPNPAAFVGEQFFDTTLGFMVWARSSTVWVNAAGVVV